MIIQNSGVSTKDLAMTALLHNFPEESMQRHMMPRLGFSLTDDDDFLKRLLEKERVQPSTNLCVYCKEWILPTCLSNMSFSGVAISISAILAR